MKMQIATLWALLSLVLFASSACADYTFLFTDSSGNASNSFNVNVGQTVAIRAYLAQTGTSTGLSAQGLNSGGVQLNTATPSVANDTTTTANSAFDQSSTTTGSNANVTEHQTTSSPVTAPTTGTDANRILLGTFTFTGMSAGTTALTTAIPSTGTSVNVIAPGGSDSGSIDGIIHNATAAITVTAVPEPGTLILTGITLAAFGAGYLRRRLLGKPDQLAIP